MSDWSDHAQKSLVIVGDAGADALALPLALGQVFRIIAAYGYHDEVAPVDCTWVHLDSGGAVILSSRAALAAGAYLHPDIDYATGFPTVLSPLICDYWHYIEFRGVMGVGKKLYICCVVEEVRGVDGVKDAGLP